MAIRRLVVGTALAALVAACSVADPPESDVVTSSLVSPATTSTLVGTSTTTEAAAVPSTTAIPPEPIVVPPVPEAEILEPLPYPGNPPRWVRSDVRLERDVEYWLGVAGDMFVLLSWSPHGGGIVVRTSVDGITWSTAIDAVGLPERSFPGNLSGGAAGVIMAMVETLASGGETESVFSSLDGIVWTQETGEGIEGGPSDVAASGAGFAVIAGQSGIHEQSLWIRAVDEQWRRTVTPLSEFVEVFGIGDVFVASVNDRVFDRNDLYLVVDVKGEHSLNGNPAEAGDPIDWDGSMLVWDWTYNQPKLFASRPAGWVLLPFPQVASDEFWGFQTLTAGASGITGAGSVWDMPDIAEDNYGIFVDTDSHRIYFVDGSDVWIDGSVSRWDPDIDTTQWFDPSGNLTIPDPATGDTIASVTCSEFQHAAANGNFHIDGDPAPWFASDGRLVPWPDQDLLHSPDGQAWNVQATADTTGPESFILATATTGETVATVVAPNGKRIIQDPPGCSLNLYPQEQPLEIWTTHTP